MNGRFFIALVAVIVVGLGAGAGAIAFQGRSNENGGGRTTAALSQQTQDAGRQGLSDLQGGERQGSYGTIENVSSSGFDLVAQNGRAKVATNSETRVTKSSDIKTTDLKVGDEVIATGEQQSDGNVAASSIQVGTAGGVRGTGTGITDQLPQSNWRSQDQGSGSGVRPQRTPIAGGQGSGGILGDRGSMVSGVIEAIDGNTITIKAQSGSISRVTADSSTSLRKTVEGSQLDIRAGQTALVTGERDSGGSVVAIAVQLAPSGMLSPSR